MECQFSTKEKYSLDALLEGVNSNIVQLIKGLLEFNPYFRLSAKEAL